jgi:hypothetical protein
MVAYLLSECRENQLECDLVENSAADVRATDAVVGRQKPVSLY